MSICLLAAGFLCSLVTTALSQTGYITYSPGMSLNGNTLKQELFYNYRGYTRTSRHRYLSPQHI